MVWPVADDEYAYAVVDNPSNSLESILIRISKDSGKIEGDGTPQIGTQDSGGGLGGGRNHWPVVMSMTIAGGGLRHGQVIGSTEKDAGQIKERPVTPGDLAATIFRHMDVPLNLDYLDSRGRPRPVIDQGAPLRELFG